jgi:membrane protein DedA with SNARE-associated domain
VPSGVPSVGEVIGTLRAATNAVVKSASSGPPEGPLTEFVTDVMEKLGAPGAGLAVALENLFPPIPSEVILPLAGFAASRGEINLLAAIFWTTLGSTVGAMILYWIGAALGRDRMRALAVRVPLVKLRDVDQAESWFARHGKKAVLFGRMVPLVRSFISVPAGVERMPVGSFLLLTSLGSLAWNSGFVVAGFLLGENWHRVDPYAGVLQQAVLIAVALTAGYFLLSRLGQSRRQRPAPEARERV